LTDQFIVGSQESKRTLSKLYGIAHDRIDTLPYPIDLELFTLPRDAKGASGNGDDASLRVCWLGRIIPRKRLDLFLVVPHWRSAKASMCGSRLSEALGSSRDTTG
jgi:glycosyltransferase involved in cell wall biosynthesis